MYAVETQYQPTMPAVARQRPAEEAVGNDQRPLDRLGFVQLVHRHLNQARRHGTCPAVLLVTLQATDAMVTTGTLAQHAQWLQALRERLRQQLRRSDLLLPLEGGCMGVLLLDTQAPALPKIQQRLQKAMAWPLEGRAAAARPQLRMGAAVDSTEHGQEPSAEELVWAAERALRPVTAGTEQAN
ncbi:MAG TPA: diguanylate cyclase [Ideonella sp.]|uniref:diguanylate cyclase domain-containing protein n=1 Tax=Ideonella sp. TaxID=1929293 RepID=UPI002C3D687A|nr:diguanylate cyclase [Ideonella sp.]HSI51820.1 diguanylate cyclase [Ideonella sp.]